MIYPSFIENHRRPELKDGMYPLLARTPIGIERLNLEIADGFGYVLVAVVSTTAGPQFVREQVFNGHLVRMGEGYFYSNFLDIPSTSQAAFNRCYGEIREVVQGRADGRSFVQIGQKRLFAPEGVERMFLWDYIKDLPFLIFGSDWFERNELLPEQKKHPLLRWIERVQHLMKIASPTENGQFEIVKDVEVASLTAFCWDLFVLMDNEAFSEKIVSRLKIPDQFAGARYELFAAATFVKAGFAVEYLDESGAHGKSAEFMARHKISGELIEVEAKTRNFNFEQNSLRKSDRFVRHLRDSLAKKKSGKPLLVFINLATFHVEDAADIEVFMMPLSQELYKHFGEASVENPDPFNAVIFTLNPNEWLRSPSVWTPQKAILMRSAFPIDPFSPLHLGEIHRMSSAAGSFPKGFIIETLPRDFHFTENLFPIAKNNATKTH